MAEKIKPKVLCVCAMGENRSRYLAKYLKNKGYQTRFGGVDIYALNPVKAEDVHWADVVIIVRKRLEELFLKKYKKEKKRLIVLDVADQSKYIPEEYAYLRKLTFDEFQKVWTYPQLRKQLKPYMPLKI